MAQKQQAAPMNDGGNMNLISLKRLLSFDLEIFAFKKEEKRTKHKRNALETAKIMRAEGSLRQKARM